jgi:CubicO group peptidase (beta-lactamase class C family)
LKTFYKNIIVFTVWIGIVYAVISFCITRNDEKTAINTESVKLQHSVFSFTEQQKKDIETYFDRKHKYQGFNGTVLIGQKDSIFFSKNYGYADYKLKTHIDNNSVFQLASVSKQFTAVAILQLYQKGLLNIDDTIQKYIHLFPYKGVTIQQLLTHRSGLPNYHYFFQHIPTTYDTILTNRDVITEMINKVPKAYYTPNRRYLYSNTGYAILAYIVERITGMTFNEYIHRYIFSPLNMNDSFTYIDILSGRKENTTGYLRRWKPAEYNYLDGVMGDKGVYCSAGDLFKWDQGLYTGKIINTDTLALAFRPLGKPKRFKSNYGFGWRMYNHGKTPTKILYHAGWWHGYRSLLMRVEQDSTTVIVLRNRSKGSSISYKQIIRILYP